MLKERSIFYINIDIFITHTVLFTYATNCTTSRVAVLPPADNNPLSLSRAVIPAGVNYMWIKMK